MSARRADGLLVGFVNVAWDGADSYANLHAQLMPWSECELLVAEYCAQAGLAATAAECVAHWREQLRSVAASVDAGYPDNADLVLDGGWPVLKRRTGKDRRASALPCAAFVRLISPATTCARRSGGWPTAR